MKIIWHVNIIEAIGLFISLSILLGIVIYALIGTWVDKLWKRWRKRKDKSA